MDPNNVSNLPMDITDDDKLWAALCWFFAPITPVLALWIMTDKGARPFIKYNAWQALVLSVVVYVLSAALSFVFIGCFLAVAYLVYVIYLTIQAYNGNMVTVPVVTDFCKNQGWI